MYYSKFMKKIGKTLNFKGMTLLRITTRQKKKNSIRG